MKGLPKGDRGKTERFINVPTSIEEGRKGSLEGERGNVDWLTNL